MPCEILNEDKTNVGGRLFSTATRKETGVRVLALEYFLEATPLRASEKAPLNPPPEVQIASQFCAF